MGLTWLLCQVIILERYHWTVEGCHGQGGGCLKIEPGGNFFRLLSVMWMSLMLKALHRPACYGFRTPSLNWVVRPLLWWIRLSPSSLPSTSGSISLCPSWHLGLSSFRWKLGERPPRFPDFGGWVRNGWEVSGISKLSSVLSLSGGLWRVGGWESWDEQNKKVLLYLKCFLTSFCAPVKGPASSVWLGHVPVPCSTACLVQLMIPGAACHSSFYFDPFQFIFQCSCLWSLQKFPFSICLVVAVLLRV